MSSYLISGPSGSGKSTVGGILKQQGFRVIETDFEEGLSGWFNNHSGKKVKDMPTEPYTQEWHNSHSWLWDKDRMSEVLSSVGDQPVFFCGGAYNEKDFYSQFDKRFGLCVDGKTLVERLQKREPQRWVEGSAEYNHLLQWNEKYKDFCIANGSIVIESSIPPEEVAEIILSDIS